MRKKAGLEVGRSLHYLKPTHNRGEWLIPTLMFTMLLLLMLLILP